MPRRSLILGVWTNLPTRQLEHFLASIISSGFEGDVVLFVHGLALETMRDLKRHGVETWDAGPYLRQDIDIQTSRYVMYLDFLSRRPASYDHVMLTDVRDVVFQADPFLAPLVADVVFAMERIEIANCPFNSGWANEAYGRHYLRQVRHLPVSCSGTTFGTTAGIMRYLSLMVREILATHAKSQRGIDQAFHTRIVHVNPPDRAYCDDEERFVATLGYLPDEAICVEDDIILLDGRVVPVVHQWDRKKTVSDLVTTHPRYRLGGQHAARSSIAASKAVPQDVVVYFDDGGCSDQTWHFSLSTLRATGFAGAIVCLATRPVTREENLLARWGCEVVHVPPQTRDGADLAPVTCAQWLQQTKDDEFGKIIVFDGPDYIFISDPFTDMRHRLEWHAEGGRVIGDCEQTSGWIGQAGGDISRLSHRYIASPSVISGGFHHMRTFFESFRQSLGDHAHDVVDHASVRSLFNLHVYASRQPFPAAVMPNGALVFFQVWDDPALLESVPTFRYNKTRPAIIQSPGKHEFLRKALQFEIRSELWNNQRETQ